MKRLTTIILAALAVISGCAAGGNGEGGGSVPKPLHELQQEFLDLRFGMFIHFNIPTYSPEDWCDPQLPPEVFNPVKLDCGQWADAAVSAGMKYGCLTTKHHSGFCIWPTATTDYNVMNSPCRRDVVGEFVRAFRSRGLKVCLYYSILDIHHDIRSGGWAAKREKTEFIKRQLTELLTNYGDIACLVIDGWDANWSRISYDEIPFEEIYRHVKSLQPDCLVTEHNCGKYPPQKLFYTDVKHYEQNAGQKISRETNVLPAQSGIPINAHWFWKEDFPVTPVKGAEYIVNENILPLNEAHCNFILNVAPNRDGLIDDNAVEGLKAIGRLWKHPGKAPELPVHELPIISRNSAKGRLCNSSWSSGPKTSDYATDDDFTTGWLMNGHLSEHWIEVLFDAPTAFNAVGFFETTGRRREALPYSRIGSYEILYSDGRKWHDLEVKPDDTLLRLHRLDRTYKATKIRFVLHDCRPGSGIGEILVYHEKNR